MQEPISIAEAYYQQALTHEKEYRECLQQYRQEEIKYQHQVQVENEADAYGYYGSGRRAPDASAYDAAKSKTDYAYSRFYDNLKIAFQHGSAEAALKMVEYGLKLETKGATQFGLQDKDRIATSLYAKAQELKANYQTAQNKYDVAWEKFSAESCKAAEEDAQGYYGAGRTEPNSSGISELEKAANKAKNHYVAGLQEAASFGSMTATQDLIRLGKPLQPSKDNCLVM